MTHLLFSPCAPLNNKKAPQAAHGLLPGLSFAIGQPEITLPNRSSGFRIIHVTAAFPLG